MRFTDDRLRSMRRLHWCDLPRSHFCTCGPWPCARPGRSGIFSLESTYRSNKERRLSAEGLRPSQPVATATENSSPKTLKPNRLEPMVFHFLFFGITASESPFVRIFTDAPEPGNSIVRWVLPHDRWKSTWRSKRLKESFSDRFTRVIGGTWGVEERNDY